MADVDQKSTQESSNQFESGLTQSAGGPAVAEHPEPDPSVNIQSARFEPLEPSPSTDKRDRKLDMLIDLTLPVSIELGRTNMMIKDILDLQRGSIIEFEKLASEPVDILINGKKMAEGEVVIIEKHFGIRITNLVDASERVKNLGK